MSRNNKVTPKVTAPEGEPRVVEAVGEGVAVRVSFEAEPVEDAPLPADIIAELEAGKRALKKQD